ncbi:MAG: hypothetical protein ACI82O_000605 [Patiriisocius sp.]|jgi:hypothetical protein
MNKAVELPEGQISENSTDSRVHFGPYGRS